MSKRRQSAGLPSNFRYPLITPDHERDSFIGYESYDDDVGHSQDTEVVYPIPAYQPRDKNPTPQLVRVAKQPEMVRRQSVRPLSGDWGTFDANNPVSDAKVPGSFHDADAEDMEPEIVHAVPRNVFSYQVENDSDGGSDENLDFGHEDPLVFPQLPLEEVVLEVAYILRTKSSPPGEGFAYVFADPTGRNKCYSIGSAKNVSQRANEHRSICNLSYFRVQRKPATPLRQYKRLEKLAQAELINMSYDPNCVCNLPQRQFFWGREQTAFEILEFWSKWLTKHSPYDKNGYLLSFWEHRLRVFEANIQKYFDCEGAKCVKLTTDTVACPICLRAGWKAFTEPTGLDKIEFSSRTQIGNQWIHKVLLYLYKYVPIQDSVWVASVDGIAQAASICDRFKSPAILLNLLYARLLIPMLWNTIFTAADYISFISMMEIVIFSVVYQMVRLELAQLAAHRRAAGREARLVRRKALPSTSEKMGEGSVVGKPPKEPRILEIPDDRAQNVPKQVTTSSKSGGKKSESAFILSPAEAAAARLKRYKPGRRRSDFFSTHSMYPSPNSGGRSDEEARQPSKRTARACDACYKRKIKCDAAMPQCNWCSHHDTPCTFDRKIRRTRKRVLGAKDAAVPGSQLSERIARIEKLLSEKLPLEPASPLPQSLQSIPNSCNLDYTPSPPAISQSTASSSVPLHFAGRELGAISLFTGIPFILPEGQEWVQSRTGQKLAFDGFTSSRVPWEKQRGQTLNAMLMHLQSPKAFDLPDRATLEANFEVYRTSLMQRIFPVVNTVLFYSTINSAYKERGSGSDSAQVSSKACVFAFAAFVSMLCNPCLLRLGHKLPRLDEEACLVKARHLLFQILQEPPTLDGLQAVMIIALVELVTGNLQSANYYGSISARMIFMLGGHIFNGQRSWLPTSFTDTEARVKSHLRNLFWLCYTIEQDVCLRTGQAQLFSEDNCDLTLPPAYDEEMYQSLEFHHNSTEIPENPIFPMDLHLSVIKARAYSALYSFKAMKKTDAEILRDIRELDDELERWRLSVPPKWRPTLSFSHERPDPNCNMHSVILRLNYHLCMTIIHQASSRCKSWATQGTVMDGVSSSLALSVEASRSTLLYLETSGHVLVDGVFWTLIFYPMSALLAIFCNILTNPAEPQASKDLSLLKSATGMLERVFLRQAYSVNELVHVKLVADFVNELCRLATCAMDKAWRERGLAG
ncbi:putative C6 transcription factor [Aspergillus undulatus]|uniref:putative C6 transcription factor n=1 Tax=Aspergillus undulatus TaxID=1810928 RepID=UPI003CCD6441